MKQEQEGTTPQTEVIKIEKRGRKPTERHIRAVTIWVHDDIICGGTIYPKDSKEFLKCLDAMQGILTRFCYENQKLFKTNP